MATEPANAFGALMGRAADKCRMWKHAQDA